MPAELSIAPLRALAALVSEKVTRRKDANRPYVGLEDMRSGSAELVSYSPSNISVSTNSVFEKGDVLFGKLRPNLRKSVIAPFSGYCSTDILVLHPRPGADPRYVGHLFRSETVASAAVRTAIGTKMPRTSWADLEDLRVFAPQIEEQRAITQILDTIDKAILSTEQLVAKLGRMKQGLLEALLTRGVDDNGELRDPLRHPEQFQDTAVGRIPRGWKVYKTVDAAAPSAGSTTIGPFGSNLLASDYRREGVPVIFVRDIREDGFAWTSDVYVDAAKGRSLSAHAVEPGDVVITKMGLPPCVAAVYPAWMPLGVVTADVIRLRPNPAEIRAGWITAFLNSNPVRAQVRKITAGVTRPKVTLADFRQLQIAVPPITEQDAILAREQASAKRIRCEIYDVEKLRCLKLGLSNDILTGRVRVTTFHEGDPV